ncbi:hypothetical protein BU23DRAFT_559754 [Bimuria novae-zelandiae CBS 107.79]|uniref:Mediator of RNA polymerase II transcription subunit 12 n=1 Tax=Bimuria novae-zelandiae CBS 107.79 TaxID=1447943 RepID=A0A6A5UR71_9PLEO|nr:hypothetical protein BU23DRAFT_559754 [Bimuria novae-zelandiae CBS 107.79]
MTSRPRATCHHGPDAAAEHDRAADERPPKAKPTQLDSLQTTASDSVRLAPKGKPQLFFTIAADSSVEASEGSPTAGALPVPPRPSLSIPPEAFQQRHPVPGGSGVKVDPSLTKSGHQDIAAPAASLPGGRAADVYPWTGTHPEDVLSETVVKGGISNKPQIINETNTARPSLWANLKNKSGTSTLSTLFIAVLEKRQACSRLTAPNTFKPPPRLTLRDSTRETWLHDLANPAVGLRRLSRTIPHGITGKVLLEQCLNKSIPIPRALWLAKCVGVNEMRAHKRKGQAGTITWIRGWTSSVEQFLDGVIAGIGLEDWKGRITYALQLAAHLFKEHLVEEDHFMDWILNSLESSTLERLFLWLLITCIPDYWANLVSSRRRGTRLAQSLLTHAEKIYTLGAEVRTTSVASLLESVITRVAISKSACLLIPNNWARCKEVLNVIDQRRTDTKLSLVIADLDDRNRSVMHSLSSCFPTSKRSLRKLYRLLDSLEYQASLFVDNLAFDCMDLFPDKNRLVSAVLKWSSSLYRQGLHRVYLVTRLLRKWNEVGVDVCEGIMSYLPELASDRSKVPDPVFRIIAELVRSKTFLPGKYLQWLIATGSMGPAQQLNAITTWQLRLLTEIPLTGLSTQVLNLRRTMLRSTSYPVAMEEELIFETKETILRQLTDCSRLESGFDCRTTLDTNRLSRTICLELAMWLRRQVASAVEPVDCGSSKDYDINITSPICTVSPAYFEVVRSYLENFNDLPILADVVGIVATSYDHHVLSASIDTLCYHFKAFKAIGAFDTLFERVVTRYTAIRALHLPERDLLLSLGPLFQLDHVDSQLMQMLEYDLGRYEQRNSHVVCSPASDTMAESNVRSGPEEEIERILSSGNNMDWQTMNRVLVKIVSYIEERSCQGIRPTGNLTAWLRRLQIFEERTFRTVLTSWLHSALASHEQRALFVALPPLIVSGCLTMPHFLETILDHVRRLQRDRPVDSFRIAVRGLDNVLPHDDLISLQRYQAYQFRMRQVLFCRKQDSALLELIKEAFQLSTGIPEDQTEDVSFNLLLDDRVLSVIRHFAIVDLQSVSFLLEIPGRTSNDALRARVTSVLDRIMDPRSVMNLSKMPCDQQATAIFRMADQLSLPFCQLKLRDLFSAIPSAENPFESFPAAFIKLLSRSLELDHGYLLDLLSGSDAALKILIRERAEEEIVSLSAFLCDPSLADKGANHLDEPPCIPRLLDVICATTIEGAGDVQVSLLTTLVERFRGIADALHQLHARAVGPGGVTMVDDKELTVKLCTWLHILLRLVVYRAPALVSKANHQHQAALMWNLRNLFTHPHLRSFPSTTQYIFDVAALLSDHVSEEVRKSLLRLACTRCSKDSRSTFIFGTDSQHDGWLGLIRSANQTMASPPQSQTPTTAQAQAPMAHFGAGATSSQRPSSQQQAQAPPGRGFAYPQHQQSHKILSQQLQRQGSNGQNSQSLQMQQMQQMQVMAQQRQVGGQPHRTASNQSQPMMTAKSSTRRQERADVKAVPYSLNRWEILPDSGGNAGGNETAISLNLFSARRA